MKKKIWGIIFLGLMPLLMANSPSPYPYPDLYKDYTIANSEVEISEEDHSKIIIVRGEITNTGQGIIDLDYSLIKYYVSNRTYQFPLRVTESSFYNQGIAPNAIYVYELQASYVGSLPVGLVTPSPSPTSEFRGYAATSFLENMSISNLSLGIGSYDVQKKQTAATISFDYNNQSGRGAVAFYVSYTLDNLIRTSYLNERIKKDDANSLSANFMIEGDVSSLEVTDISLYFLPIAPYYDNQPWSATILSGIVVGIAIVLGAIIAASFIIVLIVLLIAFLIRLVKKPKL